LEKKDAQHLQHCKRTCSGPDREKLRVRSAWDEKKRKKRLRDPIRRKRGKTASGGKKKEGDLNVQEVAKDGPGPYGRKKKDVF